MKISTTFNFNKIQFDKTNDVIAMTSLIAPEVKSDNERAPLNLSLVLDGSSSMSGDKMAKLRKSVSKLIEQLTDKDTVAITLYESHVEEILAPTLMSAENKAKAIAQIRSLRTGGCTNMSGGMLKGFEQLKRCELVKGSVYRMLVFTDGQANIGLLDKEEFFNMVTQQVNDSSITVSCFGYGQGYREDILSSIAEAGKGNFYYIDNVDDIAKSFARELGGLLSCYAQNISIHMSIKEDSGVFEEVINDLTVDAKEDHQSMKISLDDMYSEEEQYILVKTKLEKVTKAVTQRPSSVIDILVTYNDLTDKGKLKEIRTKAKIEYVKEADVQKEEDTEVLKQKAIIELSKAHEVARMYAAQGDYKSAQAAYFTVSGVVGAQGATGVQGCAGTTWATTLAAEIDSHDALFQDGQYTETIGRGMSNAARGLKHRKSIGGSSADLFTNKKQRIMEKEFEDNEDGDTLTISGDAISVATTDIKDLDITKVTSGTVSVDLQDILAGNPLDVKVTATAEVKKKKSLSKKRTRE